MAIFESLKQPLDWERTLYQQESPRSPLHMQAHLGLAPSHSEELLQAPSKDQIRTFQQRAWSSKEFQIELHERVAEMSLGEQENKNLYHLIHQRDIDSIRDIIEMATMDNEETSTDEKSNKEGLKEKLENLRRKLEGRMKTAEAAVKPFLSARLPFKRTSRNLSRMRTAHILQVPGTGQKDEDIFNVHLVRYFVDKVWKLERPDVIISVTGGAAKNFDLRPEYNENLMRGMMEGARRLKTWFITGGTNAGIMKSMGEARAKYNPSAPLIGVTSLPAIAGGLQLRRMNTEATNEVVDSAVLKRSPTLQEIMKRCQERCNSLKEEYHPLMQLTLPTYIDPETTRKFQQDLSGAWIECIECIEKDLRGNTKPGEGSEISYDDLVQMDEAVAKGVDKPHLDPNHSHFILVDKETWNETNCFGADRDFRAAFESAVVEAETQKGLCEGLHGMDVRGGQGNASHNIADHEAPIHEAPIPHVLVCVQGGPFTVDTVLQACQQSGINTGTPVLLVRGSGKAADLLSDAVRLQFTPSHSAHVSWLHFDIKQDAFWTFLKLCHVDPREYKETNLYDWGKAIKYMESHQTDQLLLKSAKELVRTTYKIFASEVKEESKDSEECLTILQKSLKVALTKKGWVYDLQSTEPGDDFNLALLKCLLNGIASVGEESPEELKEKLRLSMIWSCDDIIDYLLERISKRIDEKKQQDILDNALLFALKEHKVHALNCLIHRGTGVQMLDVGNGFCYVKDFSNYCEDCSKVAFTVNMPYTEAAFDTDKQKRFTAAMASTADISPDKVVVPSITEGRWKGETKVETMLLAVNSANAQALVSQLGSVSALKTKIDAQLTQTGLAASTHVSTPISTLSKESIKKHVVKFCDGAAAEKEADFVDRDRKRYFDAASNWTNLIEAAKERTPYFVVMWNKAEKNLRSASPLEDHENIIEMYEKDCWQAGHPIPETLRLQVYQYYKNLKEETKQVTKNLKEETKQVTNMTNLLLLERLSDLQKQVTNMTNLLLLESLYVNLCGPAFRYRMGVLGDQWFDLFFWYVLQNDKDLACVMWEHVKYPVRSAICAAYLLRRMAKNKNIDPMDRGKMLENSSFFDKKATDVQRAAEDADENRELAAQSLDCDLFLWRGMSLMDLAVKGDCESFLETESFKRCVHCRLYGDLSPDGNDRLWRQFKLIFFTLTFGLPPTFFPGFLKWASPPRSEGVRHSTQRRVIPGGYPHRPSQNRTLRKLKDECYKEKSRNDVPWIRANNVQGKLADLLKMRDNEIENLTRNQLEALWAPSFGRRQRWGCFMSAPYTVFLLNCFVTFGVTLFFTVWFVWMRLQPSSFPDMRNNMTGHEIFLNLYFVGCLLREMSQFWVSYLKCQGYVEGLFEYFTDVWNFPEVLGLISFFVGFWCRFACIQSGGCEPVFSAKDNSIWFSFSINNSSIETYNLFYALSLFFNWIRVLRCLCLTKLGVTIGIFFSMLHDFLTWLILYVILLVAISMLFVGTSSVETLVPGYQNCSNGTDLSGDDLPENGYIGCSFAYVLIRPMLQSFGEFSLAEMTNLYSFTFLLVTYFFLNLLLINLLIATMSSTYATVSAKAAKWKLIYEYELVQEHARRSIAFPAPFNLVLLIVDLCLFKFHPQVQENLMNNYPDYTCGQRLERFLARNKFFGTDHRVRGATYSTQDLDDATTQAEISVLMGRAQRTVMNKEHSKGSLEDRLEHAKEKLEEKLDCISKDAKCIQGMQQASNRGSTRARMLDKRAFYTHTPSDT